jgi:hypothetical protein
MIDAHQDELQRLEPVDEGEVAGTTALGSYRGCSAPSLLTSKRPLATTTTLLSSSELPSRSSSATVWLASSTLTPSFGSSYRGDLSINDYCRKMKWMADNLHDLDEHVEDRTLVLDVLRGLNKKYDHVKTYPKQVPSFPSFHDIRNDLLLEELTLDAEATSGSTTTLAASGERQQRPSPTPRPPWWSSIPNSPQR